MEINLLANAYDSFIVMAGSFALLVFVLVIVLILGWMRIYKKAGKPQWTVLVPFYNTYVLLQIVKVSAWWLVPLWLPFLNGVLNLPSAIAGMFTLVSFVAGVIVLHKLSQSFGKGVGFTVGLVILNPIFAAILGFGKSQYLGANTDNSATPPQPQTI